MLGASWRCNRDSYALLVLLFVHPLRLPVIAMIMAAEIAMQEDLLWGLLTVRGRLASNVMDVRVRVRMVFPILCILSMLLPCVAIYLFQEGSFFPCHCAGKA